VSTATERELQEVIVGNAAAAKENMAKLTAKAKTLRTALKAVDGCVTGRDQRAILDSISGRDTVSQAVLIDGATWKKVQDALKLTKVFR
jgi:hypothetical protein